MKLEFPNPLHKAFFKDFLYDFQDKNELSAPFYKMKSESFEEFLGLVNEQVSNSSSGVNAHFFFLTNGTSLLGGVSIRHHINHPNLDPVGGHIGYCIRPSERGKGFGKEILRLGIVEAKKIGLEKVLITCNDSNTASIKIIEANGGIFERNVEKAGVLSRRYWVDLS